MLLLVKVFAPLSVITLILCSSTLLQLHSLDLQPCYRRYNNYKSRSVSATGKASLPLMASRSQNKANSRGEFLAQSKALVLKTAALLIAGTTVVTLPCYTAKAATTDQQFYNIKACDASSDNKNCFSTASVKDLYLYTPPWTYECSPDEAFARLKGSIASDPGLSVVVKDEENRYIKVQTERNALGGGPQDEIEFLVRGSEDGDNVVTFRSERSYDNGISDFGAMRNRLENLRKRATVFEVMGGGLTADSYDVPLQKNGIFGQLKAFYGLQSGEGYEDVFSDDID